MSVRKYLLILDERGTKSIKSRRRTFTLGGIVLPEQEQINVISVWEGIKEKLCGQKNIELKWSHFFAGHHQQSEENPLLTQDSIKWRQDAMWALDELFNRTDIFPITTVVRKDRASEGLFELTRKGKKVLAIQLVMSVVLGQLARYLLENNGKYGEIWCDELGSKKEQVELNAAVARIFSNLNYIEPSLRPFVGAVNPNILFFDSKQKPIIQVADFVSGVIWASVEGDNQFFLKYLEKFVPGGKRTYGIVSLEA